MNALMNRNQNIITMSSLELVVFINKHRDEMATMDKPYIQLQHSDFLKKVPLVLGEDAGKFSSIYKDGANRDKPCYSFPKREACLMAMSYSYDLQARVFDQMTAMEETLHNKLMFDISNPHHLLQAIEIQSKQNIELTYKVEVLEPKAQALDVLSNSYGTETLDCAAHSMGIQSRKTMRPWMKEHGWLHKDKDGQWRALGHRITSGHLIEVDRVYTDSQGFPQHSITVYITPKGKTVLTTSLIKAGMIKGDRHETTI